MSEQIEIKSNTIELNYSSDTLTFEVLRACALNDFPLFLKYLEEGAESDPCSRPDDPEHDTSKTHLQREIDHVKHLYI